MPRTFDTVALRRPVAPAEVRSYRRQVSGSEDTVRDNRVSLGRVLAWAVAVIWVPIAAGQVAADGFGATFEGAVAVGGLFFLAGLVGGFLFLFRDSGAAGLEAWREQLRCLEFAAANRLEYEPRGAAAEHPGIIFKAGYDRETVQRIRSASGSYFELGTHRYLAGASHDERLQEWRYAAFPLPGVLPYLLLNSRIDETQTGDLGEFGAPERRQFFGGELDEHFVVYCRPENRVDAFYVLTPDLMALLIDHARDLDVEIAGSWLFLYSRHRLAVSDPSTWQRLAVIEDKIIPLVGARACGFRDRDLR